MPRRKKYPGLAYKTNEIFEAAAAGLPSGMASSGMSSFGGVHTLDRARVIVWLVLSNKTIFFRF